MSLHLSEKVERLIEERVERGNYRSPDEVVMLALDALDERDHELSDRALAFKAEIESRLASGPSTPMNFSALKEGIREEIRAREANRR